MEDLEKYPSFLEGQGINTLDYEHGVASGKIPRARTNFRSLDRGLRYPTYVTGPIILPLEEHILLNTCRDLTGVDYVVALEPKKNFLQAHVYRTAIKRISTQQKYLGKSGYIVRH